MSPVLLLELYEGYCTGAEFFVSFKNVYFTHTRVPICWFTPQIPALTRAGAGKNQEPETQSEPPMWLAGTQGFEPPPQLPRVRTDKKLELGVNTGSQT